MWRALMGAASIGLLATACGDPAEPNGPPAPDGKPPIEHGEILLKPYSSLELAAEVGSPVSEPPRVVAMYSNGQPARGANVFFTAEGGGSVAIAATSTDTNGVASATRWTLGRTAGLQTLAAWTPASNRQVIFTARALGGPPASMRVVAGNDQVGRTAATLRDPLQVEVRDAYGNRLHGVTVNFQVIFGGGAVEYPIAATDPAGVAVAGEWRMGPNAGLQEVLAESGNSRIGFVALACECLSSTIAYVRDGDVFARRIHAAEQPLTAGGAFDSSPAWSPDGSRLAFTNVPGGLNYFGSIHTMRADGSNRTTLIDGGTGPDNRIGGLGHAAWSPDGRQLAITRGDNIYDAEILLADEDGNLSSPIALLATFPDWSPDGNKIVFVGLSGDDGYHTLHVMNANGTGKRELIPSDGSALDHPRWSPDGRRIAYSRCDFGSCQLWVMFADGSGRRQLTNVDTNEYATSPAWSPDGSLLAFSFREGISRKAWVSMMLVDNGNYSGFMKLWEGHSPAWRPEGR